MVEYIYKNIIKSYWFKIKGDEKSVNSKCFKEKRAVFIC